MSAPALADRLQQDLARALRAGDSLRVSTIRLARASIHNEAIERGRVLTDTEVEAVLGREMKRRREAIEAYTKAGRDDLARKESLELAILSEYLPPQLADDELQSLVADAVAKAQAKGPQDTGRVMAVVMPQVKGRADGSRVSQFVRAALSELKVEG